MKFVGSSNEMQWAILILQKEKKERISEEQL